MTGYSEYMQDVTAVTRGDAGCHGEPGAGTVDSGDSQYCHRCTLSTVFTIFIESRFVSARVQVLAFNNEKARVEDRGFSEYITQDCFTYMSKLSNTSGGSGQGKCYERLSFIDAI